MYWDMIVSHYAPAWRVVVEGKTVNVGGAEVSAPIRIAHFRRESAR